MHLISQTIVLGPHVEGMVLSCSTAHSVFANVPALLISLTGKRSNGLAGS